MTPVQLLRGAFNDVTKQAILGSCTVCMAVLKREDTSSDPQQWYYYLDVANLGDSGILILRPDSEDLSKLFIVNIFLLIKKKKDLNSPPFFLETIVLL